MAETWGVKVAKKGDQNYSLRKHPDDLRRDSRIEDSRRLFEINIVNCILDVVIVQINRRFESFNTVVKKFEVLLPKCLTNESISDDEIAARAEKLCDQ